MKEISVLIVSYNRAGDTLELLENLAAQKNIATYVLEILLLNNASTDDYSAIEQFISAHRFLPVIYISHDENLGVARGRNYLIERSAGKYLLVLDDDVVLAEETAIETIASLFGQERYVTNNTAIITLDIFYLSTGRRQITAFPHKNIKKYLQHDWFLTYYFTGAAHLMKREIFDHTGLYPVAFFYGMEEYDLSYRVLDAGYSIAYDNSVKVYHKESPLGRLPNRKKLSMMWLNKSTVAWSYLPKLYFFTTLFLWSLFYLRKTKFDLAGFFKNYYKGIRILKQKRKPLKKTTLRYLRNVHARLWY